MVDDKSSSVTDSATLNKGKSLFVFLIGLFILGEVFNSLTDNFDISSAIITALLLFLVFEGYRWARLLLGILAALAVIVGVFYQFMLPANVAYLGVRLALLFEIAKAFVTAWILLLSKSTIAFLENRNQGTRLLDYVPRKDPRNKSPRSKPETADLSGTYYPLPEAASQLLARFGYQTIPDEFSITLSADGSFTAKKFPDAFWDPNDIRNAFVTAKGTWAIEKDIINKQYDLSVNIIEVDDASVNLQRIFFVAGEKPSFVLNYPLNDKDWLVFEKKENI